MLFKRANAPGAVIGWIAGVLVLLKVAFASPISFLWYAVIGFFITTGVGWAASWLFPAPPPQKLDSLTWETRNQEAGDSTAVKPDV
jgi:Na+/proline symporter